MFSTEWKLLHDARHTNFVGYLDSFAINMFNCAPVLTVLLLILACVQLEAAKDNDPVTCGSVIKLIHKETVRFVLLRDNVMQFFGC